MDAMRTYLEQNPAGGMPGPISAILNFIGENNFGGVTKPRGFAGMYRWLLDLSTPPVKQESSRPHRSDAPPELVQQARRSALPHIMLVSPEALAGVAMEMPGVLSMSSDEAVGRLTGLKALLPMCDVSHLVVVEPTFYLAAPQVDVEERVRAYLSLLARYNLPEELVQEMVFYDPSLPWVATENGLKELRTLWPEDLVEHQAWLNSDPREMALAVRALSTHRPRFPFTLR